MNHFHTDEAIRIIGEKYKPDLLDLIKSGTYPNHKRSNTYQLYIAQLYIAQQEFKDDTRRTNL